MKKFNVFISIILVFFVANIIIFPSKFIQTALNGISAWAFNVLPSVLPFMILTKLLSDLKAFEKACNFFSKPIKKIYGTSSFAGYTFFMSILSGYPVGSKMIADLYEDGKISQTDAYRMSSFCSNSGPMFIVGSVGASMLLSQKAGYILLISHILSALINGIFYRNIKANDQTFQGKQASKNNELNFGDIIISSTQAILSVGAIITFFFIVIESISPVLKLLPEPICAVFEGMIEMTRGCIDISKLDLSKSVLVPLCSFVITFGGLSTILQSITMLKKVKMKISLFTLQKFTQAIVAAILSFILCLIFF